MALQTAVVIFSWTKSTTVPSLFLILETPLVIERLLSSLKIAETGPLSPIRMPHLVVLDGFAYKILYFSP
jgi:hypothetical protein